MRAATSDRIDHADALLEADPAIVRTLPAAALVLGEPVSVNPLVALEPLGWLPLVYVAHSRYLAERRTDGLVAAAERLLEAGADPNASYAHPEFGAQSALYGAAGIAHESRLTRLLLDHGASPDDGESLYHATEARDPACVRLLLEAGATVGGTNALAHALDREDITLVELLLDHGPAPGERWDERDRALPWAIYRNRRPASSASSPRAVPTSTRRISGPGTHRTPSQSRAAGRISRSCSPSWERRLWRATSISSWATACAAIGRRRSHAARATPGSCRPPATRSDTR